MSTKRFHTVGDLSRHGCYLNVDCLGCGHQVSIHPMVLRRYCEPRNRAVLSVRDRRTDNLASVIGRLRCSKCGGKQIDWWPENRD